MTDRELEIAGVKLIIHQLDDVYDSVTGHPLTGSWVWDSALVLSNWMSIHLDFRGKSVIELGAGAGVPGLVTARLGASRVVLTDKKELIPGLRRNVEANGLVDRVEVKELIWGSDELSVGEFDVVLMSDVFFDPEEMVGLARTLKRVCGEKTMVWAASEVRPSTCECLNELTTQGFHVVELPSPTCEQNSTGFAIYSITQLGKENGQPTQPSQFVAFRT